VQQFHVRMQHAWQPCGKRLHKTYIVHTVKQPLVQMVWGYVSCWYYRSLQFGACNDHKQRKMYQLKKKLRNAYICWSMQHFHAWWGYLSQK